MKSNLFGRIYPERLSEVCYNDVNCKASMYTKLKILCTNLNDYNLHTIMGKWLIVIIFQNQIKLEGRDLKEVMRQKKSKMN